MGGELRTTLERMEHVKTTLAVTWEDTVEAFKNALSAIGEFMAPVTKNLLDWLIGVGNWVRNLPDGMKNLIAKFILFGAVLLPVGLGLKAIAFTC